MGSNQTILLLLGDCTLFLMYLDFYVIWCIRMYPTLWGMLSQIYYVYSWFIILLRMLVIFLNVIWTLQSTDVKFMSVISFRKNCTGDVGIYNSFVLFPTKMFTCAFCSSYVFVLKEVLLDNLHRKLLRRNILSFGIDIYFSVFKKIVLTDFVTFEYNCQYIVQSKFEEIFG